MQPTTTEMWQWQCGTCRADWKMMRQVTTSCCPHGQGGRPPSPAAGNPAPHCHHHHHRQEEVQGTTTSRASAADAGEGSKADAGRHTTHHHYTLPNSAPPPVVVAELCWVPDAYLMVQQLREFESLNDELVALRVQLQEYADEIHKSITNKDINGAGTGMNWLLALPANVRDVVVMARDVIESFIAISITSAPPTN